MLLLDRSRALLNAGWDGRSKRERGIRRVPLSPANLAHYESSATTVL